MIRDHILGSVCVALAVVLVRVNTELVRWSHGKGLNQRREQNSVGEPDFQRFQFSN